MDPLAHRFATRVSQRSHRKMYITRMQKLLGFHYLYLLPLLLSTILSLRAFKQEWAKPYRLFSVFLWTTLAFEIFALAWKWELYQTAWWSFKPYNLWIYNLALILRNLFYGVFFEMLIPDRKQKRVVRFAAAVIFIFGIADYLFIETPHQVNSYNIIAGNILVILMCFLFSRSLLEQDKLIVLYRHPAVWISLGAFVYHTGSLPFFICLKYWAIEFPKLSISLLYINHSLNIIMYLLFITAFVCKPQYQR
jgi:hypothetical protein